MSFAERYGPWAVIAGASEGTGRAFAHRLAAEGVSCILLARREAPLQALAEEIKARSEVDCIVAPVDLSASDALARITEIVGDREVGLFVSNAGSDPHGSLFLDRDLADWQALIQRNVTTTMACCHHFAAPMRARGKGGLLLVNSGACYGGSSYMAAYSASKAFMLCLAESLWAELAPHGVDVLSLVLGRTDTPALRQLLADKGMPVPDALASSDEVARAGLERLPHGPIHNWGVADETAGGGMPAAAMRRERVVRIAQASRQVFGGG